MAVGGVERLQPWQGGVLAGLAGGALMGVLLSVQMSAVIESAIPGLWTLEGGTAGWVVHMINSAVFGVVFAAIVMRWPRTIATLPRGLLTGGLYGAALWIVAAGFAMPIWLDLVGFAAPPAIPNLVLMSLVAHLIFGVVLGGSLSQLVETEPGY